VPNISAGSKASLTHSPAGIPDPTVPGSSANWIWPSWRNLIVFALLSRVVVFAVGFIVVGGGSDNSRRWEAFRRFDAIWYEQIAVGGYDEYRPARENRIAFLPALPIAMAAGGVLGVSPKVMGVLAPNLAFVVGLACFGRAALRVTGQSGTAWRACLLLTAYPYSFFFSAPYQESLGLALMAVGLVLWVEDRPWAAILVLPWAPLARLQGVSLPAAIGIDWVVARLRGRASRRWAWLVALSGGLGLLLFGLYCYQKYGDPLIHLKAHGMWGRKPASLPNLARSLVAPAVRWWEGSRLDLKNYAIAVLFLGLAAHAWWRRGLFWAILIAVPILEGMVNDTLMGMGRIALMAFAGFIDLAEILNLRITFWGGMAVMVLVQVYLIWQYSHWIFVA
jgi:hypothetical protein